MHFNQRLIDKYRYFFKSMTAKIYGLSSADSFMNRDDVYSLFLEYLWEATKKYDSTRGASFDTFLNLYISSRLKNIRRGVKRRNLRMTSYLEDMTEEKKNTLEISVYSSCMISEMNYDFNTISDQFSKIDKEMINHMLIKNGNLETFSKINKVSYSKSYRKFVELKSKITKMIN